MPPKKTGKDKNAVSANGYTFAEEEIPEGVELP